MDRSINKSTAIRKLPSEVQALIRSGNIITNASQCVTELVLNAIDAKATKIAVRVNFSYHKIQVADNGCGMSRAELDLIGERFMTSKCHSLKDLEGNLSHYGFRGEALASLKECSGLLTLESRPEDSDTTYAKVYAHGKVHSLGISKNSRPACGTTVTVHDFMYNMPVRRGRMQPNFEIEEIKSNLESIALIHPEVSFSFHNEANRQLILQTHKSSDVVGTFSQLFSKTIARSLVPVSYSAEQYSVNGYIAKETHNRKNLQFIYVNKRLVLKTKLHKIANTVLGMSFLLRHNAPPREVPAYREYTTEQWLFFSTPDRDRYAVYIFNIICPHKEYDICLDPKKTLIEFKDWDCVLQCLKNAINSFLQKECSTFNSQEKKNAQSQNQNKSLLAEVSQLDKEYVLGKYGKISEESNKTEPVHQEDNCNVKKNEKFLPGIHNIFGAVCGAQVKRKTLSNNDTTSSKSTRKHKVTDNQEMLSQSTLVLLQESSSIDGNIALYKEKEQEDVNNSSSPKTFIADHSKKNTLPCEKTSLSARALKLKRTAAVETSNVADLCKDVSNNEPSKYHVSESVDTEDNINSTCPIVKFRRMYGNFKTSVKEPHTECKRKAVLQKCVEEETRFHAQPISNAKNFYTIEHTTGDNVSKHTSKHISTKSIFIQNIDSSISGASEVPIIESKIEYSQEKTVAEDKTAVHPIQRFRLSVAKKLSHKVHSTNCHRSLENTKHSVSKDPYTITNINECRVHKPKSKQSSQQNISATKTSISICTINHNKPSKSNDIEQSKEYVPESFESLLGEDTHKNQAIQTSFVSGGNSVAPKEQQQHNIREETAKKLLSQCFKDIVFQRPLQLKKVKCCETTAFKHCSSMKDVHSCCQYNSRREKGHSLEQRMSINPRTNNHYSSLLPLWSLSYINKRKSNLQTMFPNKKRVHFHENAFCMNNIFKDCNSKTVFKETRKKYITSADFLHTVDIKDQKYAISKDQNTANIEASENNNNNTSCLLGNKQEYNIMKHFHGNWRLKAENHTINFANNEEHYFSQNVSFIFSPKQDAYAEPPAFNEIFPKNNCSVKSSNKNSIDDNTVGTFSTDIMKHYRNIITPSSGNEADVDTTVSLNTCGATFLSRMAHASSERDVNTASEILSQSCKQRMTEYVNQKDYNRDKNIKICNSKLVRNETVTAEKNEELDSCASKDVSLRHCSSTKSSAEAGFPVQNVEENGIPTLTINSHISDPHSEHCFKDTDTTSQKSGGDAAVDSLATTLVNNSSSDCHLLKDRSFANKTITSPDADISLLLSQRVKENCLGDEDRNSSIIQITSNCFSPVTSNSNESSDISLEPVRSTPHSKNVIIEETSSEIIDATPEVKRLSKELSLFERCTTKNSMERQDSILDPSKQNEQESNTAGNNKCETINLCSEMHKEGNEESNQERKRSSDDDLDDFYGKRLSLDKSVPDSSAGNILSGCTEILNEALDMLTKDRNSGNQEHTDASTTISNARETDGNKLQNGEDTFMHKQILNSELEMANTDKDFQNEVDSILLNNAQYCNSKTSPGIQDNGINLKDGGGNSDDRENITVDGCNRTDDDLCPEEWEKRIDSTGKPFYIHKESGMPSFTRPDTKSAGASYSMSERYGFLPKGLSPILKGNCDNLSKQQDILTPNTRHAFHDALVQDSTDDLEQLKQVKWREIQEFKESGCRDLLKTLVKDSEYSMQFCEKEVLRTNTKEMPKFYNTMFSYTFTKEAFSTLKVLGQLDGKFIVVTTMCEEKKPPHYIVLFDQHAVHERIRVEQLMQEYQEEGNDTKFKSTTIDSAITLSLGKDDIRILQSFRNDFENLGIHFELLDDSTIKVSSVPTCLLMREIREGKNHGSSVLKTLLESLIREQIDCLVATRGCAARVPKTLQAVINSEACKGALKFGDELTTEECKILLSSLSSCKLPFHCAHGRPSLTPIVDLEHLYIHQKPVYKPPALHKLKELFAD